MQIRKQQSHGRIGEAAVSAKCWMNGIPAYNTAGLRANFAGSDLLVDTADPRKKLLIQVKTGYPSKPEYVYFTQTSGEQDLTRDKFVSDFVVFVNLDKKAASTHGHRGELDFAHLLYFVVPRDDANRLYREFVQREFDRPLKRGGQRSLTNMSVYVPVDQMAPYKDGWHLIRDGADAGAGLTL
ncbi:hypothetical protein [Methylibium petroleiphilum]|jgi:hypothetical protein|uniref:Uncharacterized protein n=1 Tax=Methylibium petroleiphilum (strain ATCC BAA-1232 / LMG 22953 / PM1) TaxID=420662 RepID=A2SMK5_METPP|nr:hypothetical protein [Methylibium petroleiphilum]ABM96794.1 hypothetical protein Mpe_B0013 [Methylibium petroleiphilum PM1]